MSARLTADPFTDAVADPTSPPAVLLPTAPADGIPASDSRPAESARFARTTRGRHRPAPTGET